MLARVILLTYLLLMLPNLALADILLPEDTKTKQVKLENIPSAKMIETETEILQSLDNLNQQSNNEIFLVESQTPLIKNSVKIQVNKRQNDNHTTGENIMLNDGFGDLDLQKVFTDFEFDDLHNVNPAEKIKETSKKSDAKIKYGVGVVGDEAVLINTLDNSDLMDFENEVDIWSKKIVDNKKNNKNNKR